MEKENKNNVVMLRSCCSASHPLTTKQQDPEQRHLRMTWGVATRGFTLIELLVVVLIIGILSAIALPQYEKAVWRSKTVQLQTYVKNLAEAQERYKLENGDYSMRMDALDISFDGSLPNTGACGLNRLYETAPDPARNNGQIGLGMGGFGSALSSKAAFCTGKYAGGGFVYWHKNGYANVPLHTLLCYEVNSSSSQKNEFCKKVFGGTKVLEWYGNRSYTIQ